MQQKDKALFLSIVSGMIGIACFLVMFLDGFQKIHLDKLTENVVGALLIASIFGCAGGINKYMG